MLTMHILLSYFWLRYFPTFMAFIMCQYGFKQAFTRGVYICGNRLNDHGLKIFKEGPDPIWGQIPPGPPLH